MKNYINSPIYLNCSSIGEAYNSIIENFSKYREYVSYPTIITITNTENILHKAKITSGQFTKC